MISEITQEQVRAQFRYESGNLYFRSDKYKQRKTGTIDRKGYTRISFKGRLRRLHQLVYIYHHGAIPQGMQIDHIDGDPGNNKIENLRMVTYQENCWNKKATKGYFLCKKTKMYRVQIAVSNKKIEIGRFKTIEEAEKAYLKAKEKYHKVKIRQ